MCVEQTKPQGSLRFYHDRSLVLYEADACIWCMNGMGQDGSQRSLPGGPRSWRPQNLAWPRGAPRRGCSGQTLLPARTHGPLALVPTRVPVPCRAASWQRGTGSLRACHRPALEQGEDGLIVLPHLHPTREEHRFGRACHGTHRTHRESRVKGNF